MRGHDAIIKARLAGKAPGAIYFIDHPDDLPLELGMVDVRGDIIHLLDLRFVTNMMVCITSDNADRMNELVKLCWKHKPLEIAYSMYRKYY